MKQEENGNIAYIRKRHELIPEAARLTRVELSKKKVKSREMKDTAFHRNMTVLATKAGIMNPGNLVLFDTKILPKLGSPKYL